MTKRLVVIGSLLILLTQAIFQGVMARTDSQTTDEAVHVLAGYTYLTQEDFRFNPEHPPLVKTLSALPLLAIKPNLPENFDQKWQDSENFFYDSWRENRSLGEEFFYSSGNDANQMIFWSRIPIVLFTLLLGLAIFLISLRHFGPIPALVATGFYALDPLIAGHGHLVTTDVAISLGILLSAYSAWRFISTPNWKSSIWFGIAFGFALLVKHTAIIFIPVLLLLVAAAIIRKKEGAYTKRVLKGLLGSLVVIVLAIWLAFGFQSRPLPSTNTISQDISVAQKNNEEAVTSSSADSIYKIVRPALSILPGDYVKGVAMVLIHTRGGHDTFLLGNSSTTGWWYYFPTLLLLKTPLPTLIGLISLLALFAIRKPRNSLISSVLVTAGLFMVFAMSSKANLGLRHIMPVVPLIFIGVAWAASLNNKIQKAFLVGLVWLSLIFALSYPNYMGYFNELAGKKTNNYQVATDSNLDWGQDLKRIRNYIEENELVKPIVEYGWAGESSLDYYLGDNYRLVNATTPKTGDIFITGATAVNNPTFSPILDRCSDFTPITNGALVCKIER